MDKHELKILLDEYIAEHFTPDASTAAEAVSYAPPDDDYERFYPARRKVERRDETPRRIMGFVTVASVIERTDFNKLFAAKAEETFSEMLMRLVNESGEKYPAVYNRAHVLRQVASRIRRNKHYRPNKDTAVAFAIALGLDLDRTKKLLNTAGFTLTNSDKRDVIISFFIEHELFDVTLLNESLFDYGEPILLEKK